MISILRLTARKVFFLMVITPILLIIIGALLAKLTGYSSWTMWAAIGMALAMCLTYYGWQWAVAKHIYRHLGVFPPSFALFKWLFLGAILMSFLILPALKVLLASIKDYLDLLAILPLICFVFSIYLISKNLRKAEAMKFNRAHTSIFIDMLLIWLLPIGIWFIQPRIKKLFFEPEP